MSELSSLASLSVSQLVDDSGRLPRFADPVDPAYLCAQCKLVLRQACQTPCGHRICQHCVDDLEKIHGSNRFRCPTGEEDCDTMAIGEIRPDFSARRYVMLLRVHCFNEENGCDVIIQWRKIKEHVELECKHKSIPCSNNCGVINLTLTQLEDHLTKCPLQKKNCMFSQYGCPVQGIESELRKHYADVAHEHLEMVLVRLAELELVNTELRGRTDELNSNLVQTRNRCAELSASNDSLMKQVNSMATKMAQLEKTVAGQSEAIIKLEQKNIQLQNDIQRELTSVKDRCGQVERQVQSSSESASRRGPPSASLPEEVRVQLIGHDKTIGIHDVRLAELDLRLQCTETTNYEGCLIWKVTEYRRRKRDAMNGGTLSLYSQPFYTSRYGYKLCARVYLNGDGVGRGTHISFFLVVMQGDYDELLTWPFRQRVTLCLLDQKLQRRHLADTFRPDPTSSSFQKPTTPMNVASGCPLFVPHTAVEAEDSPYLVNDTLYFKIAVDCSDLLNP